MLPGSYARAVAQNGEVLQLWRKLQSPAVAAAVDLCRGRGYFFGGLLPRWFDHDGLLMQKVLCQPYCEDIQLYSENSREILRMVKNDWECSRHDFSHQTDMLLK